MAVWYVTILGKLYQEFRTKKEAQACVALLRQRGTAKHIIKIERD